RRRFNVTEYYRMAEIGLLHEDDHVELINGELIQMCAIGAKDGECVGSLGELMIALMGSQYRVRVQNPVHLSDATEPEPDLVVAHRRSYRQAHPTAGDICFLVEVADTSLNYDVGIKLPLYAAAGIAEVFIVDTIHDLVERHTEPRDGEYQRVVRAGRGESLTSTVLPAVTFPVDVALGYELPA
ncbi:MAG TPA: Uma2 family endonuclease, partial [Chloroflexota bacterium]